MSDTHNEGAPHEGEEWRHETTDYINELARQLGGAGTTGVVFSGHPQAGQAETLEPLTVARDVPELREFLESHSSGPNAVRPESVLVLSFAPSLIGGLKSHEFVVKGPHLSPDAAPDEGETVDLKEGKLPAQSWGDFIDYYNAAEHQADQQYGQALFAVKQMLAEAQSRGVPVQTLLLPGTVRVSASHYFRRLERLAQDKGVEVVIRTEDVDDAFTHYEFKRFTPPRAATVEDYWHAAGESLGKHLATICDLAYGEGDTLFYNRGAARVILAKLGSTDNLAFFSVKRLTVHMARPTHIWCRLASMHDTMPRRALQ